MRRSGFLSLAIRAAREQERQAAARRREVERQQKAEERARRSADRARQANAKEGARLHIEGQLNEAGRLTTELEARIAVVQQLLGAALKRNPYLELNSLRLRCSPRPNPEPPPTLERFLPASSSLLARLIPGNKRRQAQRMSAAHDKYVAAIAAHNEKEVRLDTEYQNRATEVEAHNNIVSRFIDALRAADPGGNRGVFHAGNRKLFLS